nr:MAG TPA: hypothetical protein [Caudoviricetes sp.]
MPQKHDNVKRRCCDKRQLTSLNTQSLDLVYLLYGECGVNILNKHRSVFTTSF